MSLRSRRLLSVVSDVGAGVSERLRGQSVAPVNLMVGLPLCSPHLASLASPRRSLGRDTPDAWWRGQTLISEHIIGIINNFSTFSPDTRWRKIENNTQRIVEKSVIMTSTSPVRVSGTVSPQDCIFSGEKGKRGIMLKQMWLLQVYTSVKTFIVVFLYPGIIPEHTKYWLGNGGIMCTRAAERA